MKNEPKTIQVTIEELLTIIAAETRYQIISIILNTVPKMRKTDNPFFGIVSKLAKYSAGLNFIYENSVNNKREKEGNFDDAPFVAQERAWGEHATKSIIIKEDGNYLQLKVEKKLEETFVNLADSTFIDKSALMPFLQIPKPNTNQLLENPVVIISPKFTNIVEVVMNGERYVVVPHH